MCGHNGVATETGIAAVDIYVQDVREFIEDLRMAGIRFVYFSASAERESKGTCTQKHLVNHSFIRE